MGGLGRLARGALMPAAGDDWVRGIENSRPHVVFVVGTARCGSTILGSTLGQLDGWFSAGEVSHLWDRGMDSDGQCACGSPVQECSIWGTVLADGARLESPLPLSDYRQSSVPFWGVAPSDAQRLQKQLRARKLSASDTTQYADLRWQVYQSVARVTGARVIVDTSKHVADASALAARADRDRHVTLLHMVRDPRAVGYSAKKRRNDRGSWSGVLGALRVALWWGKRNLAADRLASRWPVHRTRRLRYEDFAAAPDLTAEGLSEWVTGEGADVAFIDEGTLKTAANHQVSGGYVRSEVSNVEIRPDLAWRSELPTAERWVIAAAAWPLMRQYGYQLHRSTPRPG